MCANKEAYVYFANMDEQKERAKSRASSPESEESQDDASGCSAASSGNDTPAEFSDKKQQVDSDGGSAPDEGHQSSEFSEDGDEDNEADVVEPGADAAPAKRKRAKRGHADPSTWARRQKKQKKQAKDIGPCNCLLACCSPDKYSTRVRQRIRAQVDALPDRAATQSFLAKHITVIHRKNKGQPAMSIRKRKLRAFESVYSLPAPKHGDPPVRVCKHNINW
jgi:hypothetical protein